MIDPYKAKVKLNLKKAQGQLNLISKMIEDGRYCIDIAQQVNSAMGMLKQANVMILESHLQTCGVKKLSEKNKQKKDQFIKELVKTFNLTSK